LSKCSHTLAHKEDGITGPVDFFNCDLSEKGHKLTHRDQFNRVAWKIEPYQMPHPSEETGRRVSWSTDVEWRRY
jgi:hypothetical protein